jgi:hypothetical protein
MTSRRTVENWHDKIGDRTFGNTMLDRLVYCSHLLALTGGSSRHVSTPKSPTKPPFVRVPARVIGISRKG